MAWNHTFNELTALDYVNKVELSYIKRQLDELTFLVCQLAAGKRQAMQPCGICSMIGHPNNICPILQEEPYEQVNQLAHQNFPIYQQYRQPYPKQVDPFSAETSLEDMFKAFMTQAQQFQQETKTSIYNLENQMSQLATTIGRLDSKEKIPTSQEEVDNINTEADYIDEDKNVLCVDDIPQVMEVVERTDKEKLEDTITNSLGINKEEEIEQNQDLKEAKAILYSLPVISDEYAVNSIPLPVTNKQSLPFILQDSCPDLKSLPDYIEYLLLEEGFKHSCHLQGRWNLPMKNNVMDGVLKIHEVGVT